LFDAFQKPGSARPLNAEQVLWQTSVTFFYSEMDDEIVRYIRADTDVPLSATPYDVDVLGFRFFEVEDVLTNEAPDFSPKASKDPAAIAVAAAWEHLKAAATRNSDLLGQIPGAREGQPTDETITFLRMYRDELTASNRCIDFTIDRLAAWDLFHDAIDEATHSMRVAFLHHAAASPPPASLREIRREFLVSKVYVQLCSPYVAVTRGAIVPYAVGDILDADAVRKCYAQAAQFVHKRTQVESVVEGAVAKIESHIPMLHEWVQAFALRIMKGDDAPGIGVEVPAAGPHTVDAAVVAMYLGRFEWREGAAGSDMLAFLRLAELLRGVLAAIDEGPTPKAGIAELTRDSDSDLARGARAVLGTLFDNKDPNAIKATTDILRAVARAVAALEEADVFEGRGQMHTYVTKEMKEAVWEVFQWFTVEPRACPWVA
jgi:hypothetical protein